MPLFFPAVTPRLRFSLIAARHLPGALALLLAGLLALGTLSSYGQGHVSRGKNKAFTGALVFLPNSKLVEGYQAVRLQTPNDKDPILNPQNWYSEGETNVRGMVSDAVLFFEWWVLQTEPSEHFKFEWKNSGYFEIAYTNDKGVRIFKRIDRYSLQKYPNLLERFDNIKPQAISFEFNFRTGGIPDQPYYDFRRKYNTGGDLGSAGWKIDYTRTLNGNFILYKSSEGQQQWTIPGVPVGGWNEFLNFQSKHNDRRTGFIELFKLGEDLVFNSFRVSSIKWNVRDFEYIAKKFDDYESGKDKPTAFDEVAAGKKESKSGDGFWDETEEAPCKVELAKSLHNTTTKEGVVTISGKALGPKNMVREGKVLAEGYEQTFLINEAGQFETKVILRAGLNRIKVQVCSKTIEQDITLDREPVDLRATLTWDKGSCDVDLYVIDPENYTCNYQNKIVTNMRLDADNTQGYGPENVYVSKVKKGTYLIKAQNYNRAEGAEAKIYVFINERLKEILKVRFTTGKEMIQAGAYSF